MFTRSDSLFSDFSHCWLSLLWCHWPDCISPWMKISASKLPLTKETKGRLICDGDSTGELVNGVVILKMYMHAPKKRYLCLCVCMRRPLTFQMCLDGCRICWYGDLLPSFQPWTNFTDHPTWDAWLKHDEAWWSEPHTSNHNWATGKVVLGHGHLQKT